jgi:hypothetical protein
MNDTLPDNTSKRIDEITMKLRLGHMYEDEAKSLIMELSEESYKQGYKDAEEDCTKIWEAKVGEKYE